MKSYRFLVLALLLFAGLCAPVRAGVYQTTRYVGMDFSAADTAWMYDENFQRFPDIDGRRTSYESFEEQSVWLLAVDFHVVRRAEDGNMEVMDDVPAYRRINHHVVFAYTKNGEVQAPLPAGGELSSFSFPRPYAYKMEGGDLSINEWHWHGITGVPRDEQLYLQVIFTLDDEDQGYRDTNVTWVAGPIEFCVPPGEFIHGSWQIPVPVRVRPVLVIPHMHDHGYLLELVYYGNPVMSFRPELVDEYSYHISHSGCPNTFWHHHDGHLKVKGLQAWTLQSGTDLTFEAGSTVWARSYYNNPHSTPIDGMEILIVFWEPVP